MTLGCHSLFRFSNMSPASNTIKCNLHFSITDEIGKLESCLAAIKSMNVSLTRIERWAFKSYLSWLKAFLIDKLTPLAKKSSKQDRWLGLWLLHWISGWESISSSSGRWRLEEAYYASQSDWVWHCLARRYVTIMRVVLPPLYDLFH